ncbi:MAG: hypothetical protein HGA29_00880 [Syntrophaceae bacterium]|nr:hypothetical protein [Syntrophaceae bacterium]
MHDIIVDSTDIAHVAKKLSCPKELSSRHHEFSLCLVDAYAIVEHFATQHGWQKHLKTPFIHSFQIFASQDEMWQKLKELTGVQEKHPPTDGLSSALVSGNLLAVTPEEYERLRPEYTHIDKAWTRLLAHEIIHQLHIRIIGNEKRMGPKWFYEGFAMYAAGQRITDQQPSSIAEATESMHAESRGSYAKFEAVFEYFLERIELKILLKQASRHDFQTWLIDYLSNGEK